ncbi:MAG: hypothetical protein K2P59_06340, partial [Acetatifactor sp.]|nr:hypothetical protein [Acetatifactor sp.]
QGYSAAENGSRRKRPDIREASGRGAMHLENFILKPPAWGGCAITVIGILTKGRFHKIRHFPVFIV